MKKTSASNLQVDRHSLKLVFIKVAEMLAPRAGLEPATNRLTATSFTN